MQKLKQGISYVLVAGVAFFGGWVALSWAHDTEDPEYETPSKTKEILQGGIPQFGDSPWKEGLMFEGIKPQPWLESASNWFPGTEVIRTNEMRITFMGSAPMIRPGQMNTSIYVELGNGENYIFDIGEGSVANYMAAGVAPNEMNNIFISHLHVDHFGALPWVYAFGAWSGRWHEPLRVYGPGGGCLNHDGNCAPADGRDDDYGLAYMLEGMEQMMHWHKDAFDVFPIGEGWDIEVHEFDSEQDGEAICCAGPDVEIIHWRRSHAKDGASAYRLNWSIDGDAKNQLSFVWTGDGRPTTLDIQYGAGADVFVTETQTEVVAVSSAVQGVPPFLGRYTIDTHHTPGYAAGYLFSRVEPRLAMTTHMPWDPYVNAETIAEIRHHWDGPYHPGAPDLIVVNVTPDSIWVREGVVPDYPSVKAPQAKASIAQHDGLVIPVPVNERADIQNEELRRYTNDDPDPGVQIPSKDYYPDGYHPNLIEDWPTEKDLYIDGDYIPESMLTPDPIPPEYPEPPELPSRSGGNK